MSRLDQLHTFIEVYRQRSFSRAARALAITQPAVSQHIAALEAFVGKPLFVRQPQGVTATGAADELARAVGPALDGLAARLASYRPDATAGVTLHLAGPPDFIHTRWVDVLPKLMAQGFHVRVQLGDRDHVRALLAAGEADLAVTASMPDARTQGFAKLLTERLLLVLAPRLARTLAKPLAAKQLAVLPLIAYDEDLPLIRQAWMARFAVAPTMPAALTIPDLRAIEALVVAGHGWSALPDYQILAALDAGRLVSLTPRGRAPANVLYLVWNQAALRRPAIVRARDLLLEEARR